MKRMVFVVIEIMLAVMAFPGIGRTALWTETFTSGVVRTNQINTIINVNQFDSSLGTLNSATFILEGYLNGSYYFLNTTGNSTGYWAQTGDVRISYSTMNLYAQNSSPDPFPKTDEEWDYWFRHKTNPVTLTINVPAIGPTISISKSETYTFTEASILNTFEGIGQIPFVFNATSNVGLGCPGNGQCGTSTFTSGNITVTYDYTAVPIPPTVWLLGSSLVGLAGFRKRVNS
ncbi:MAG: choice-of-anchor E domain-containing protein [Proteobacteria bacterium]|nr:choice-of-anchor E domain-containing protein [Pseudomonadota bacterium]